MVLVQIRGRQLAFNDMGFMADFWAWDEEVAQGLAEEDGLQLHECHWAVIRFLREYYSHNLIPPPSRVMFRALAGELSQVNACSPDAIQQLFPTGGCRQACRIAGLPDYFCQAL
jgi:tRNA 2-thiouridine synthesizing protein E